MHLHRPGKNRARAEAHLTRHNRRGFSREVCSKRLQEHHPSHKAQILLRHVLQARKPGTAPQQPQGGAANVRRAPAPAQDARLPPMRQELHVHRPVESPLPHLQTEKRNTTPNPHARPAPPVAQLNGKRPDRLIPHPASKAKTSTTRKAAASIRRPYSLNPDSMNIFYTLPQIGLPVRPVAPPPVAADRFTPTPTPSSAPLVPSTVAYPDILHGKRSCLPDRFAPGPYFSPLNASKVA